MTISIENLRGYKLKTKDDIFGSIRDVLVEEGHWIGRWIVADTGDWLLGKKILLSPVSIGEPDQKKKEVPVHLCKEEVKSAPSLDEHAPVSHEYEKSYYDHFDWPYYWMGGAAWGSTVYPSIATANQELEGPESEQFSLPPEERKTVLRSGHELTKYNLMVRDEKKGHIEDIIFDTRSWSVKYFQFNTRKWLHGKTLLLSPERVINVQWEEHVLNAEFSEKELSNASNEATKFSDTDSFESMDAHIRALTGITDTGTKEW